MEEKELQYKDEHIGCRNYATGDKALFRRWSIEAGEALPGELNRKCAVLLYMQSGSADADAAGSRQAAVEAGHLFLLPFRRAYTLRAREASVLWTCAVPPHIPLCDCYELVDLQKDITSVGG